MIHNEVLGPCIPQLLQHLKNRAYNLRQNEWRIQASPPSGWSSGRFIGKKEKAVVEGARWEQVFGASVLITGTIKLPVPTTHPHLHCSWNQTEYRGGVMSLKLFLYSKGFKIEEEIGCSSNWIGAKSFKLHWQIGWITVRWESISQGGGYWECWCHL